MKKLVGFAFLVLILTSQGIYSADSQSDKEIGSQGHGHFYPADRQYVFVGVDKDREVVLCREIRPDTTFFQRLCEVFPTVGGVLTHFVKEKN